MGVDPSAILSSKEKFLLDLQIFDLELLMIKWHKIVRIRSAKVVERH